MVVAREYSVLSIWFNTCPPYFMVGSKITRDTEAKCSMFTYKDTRKKSTEQQTNQKKKKHIQKIETRLSGRS